MRTAASFLVLAFIVASCDSSPPSLTPSDPTDRGVDTPSEVAGLSDAGTVRVDVPEDDAGAPTAATDAEVEACDTLGCPCESADECRGGYCVRLGGDAGSVCTSPCVDECEEDGWICSLLEQDREAVALCLPEALPYCTACTRNTDCGSTSALCLALGDGDFCAPPCLGDGLCPAGSLCEEVTDGTDAFDVCVPVQGVCAGCVDADNDGHGVGPECVGADCNDLEASIFDGAPEFCDGRDNDCDDLVDEAFDLTNDDDNCGACGVSCDGPSASSTCVEGTCRLLSCDEGFFDCDGLPETGCERDEAALNSCGGCAELDASSGERCGTCDTGTLVCDGLDRLSCAGDLGERATNACGGCATLPAAPGDDCGACGSGTWVCDGEDGLACDGDLGDEVLNECGGCAPLLGELGERCGTCSSGRLACDGFERLACAGDRGIDALNPCGGCDALDAIVDSACGLCGDGIVICNGINSTLCFGADGDSDGDGVCDELDVCAGGDDGDDADGDGVPDFCDGCPLDSPDDTDGDGVCESDDVCAGFDDTLDADLDGVPNGCDVCDGADDTRDADSDGRPDGCDCDAGACDDNAECEERGDGVACTCRPGYEGDGFACADADECLGSPCDPVAECTNTVGGFACACPGGYEGDGFTCADVDECAASPCDPLATCTNTPGSFTCDCPAGWSGDGFSCECPPERAYFETVGTTYLSGLTPSTVSLSDDSVSGAVPIGFSFVFFGTTYTQVWISSNGYIMFDDGSTNGCCTGQPIPGSSLPNAMVALWWEDLDPVHGGSVRYGTSGSAPNRVFIVEYSATPHYPSGTPVTVQAVLYEGTNAIDINCSNCASDGGTHSQGIEDTTGTLGVQRYLGNSSIGAGSWRFQTCAP